MNLNKCFLTANDCYKQGVKISPVGIVVHSTGANNPNLKRYVQPDDGKLGVNQYNNSWNQPRPDGKSVCVHAFIGKLADGSIATYQTLPWDYKCWGCGTGSKGSYNNGYIQFEICEDGLTDITYLNKVYQEAAELCAYLVKLYNIPVDNIVCHSEAHDLGYASNHSDVMHWWPKHGLSMNTFRKKVKELILNELEDDNMTGEEIYKKLVEYLATLEVPSWATKELQKAIDEGITDGTNPMQLIPRYQAALMARRASKK